MLISQAWELSLWGEVQINALRSHIEKTAPSSLLLTPAAWLFSISFVWANSTPHPPRCLAFQEKQVGGDTSLGKQKISELWPGSSYMARKSLPACSWSPWEASFLYFQAEMHMQRTVLLFYLILFLSSLFLTPPMYTSQLTFFFFYKEKAIPSNTL